VPAFSPRRSRPSPATGTCTGCHCAGNRQLNHAIHIAAVAQIRNPGTEGRAYYNRRIAAGMPPRSALRALKRKVSDAI
jgi:hypothetical protein